MDVEGVNVVAEVDVMEGWTEHGLNGGVQDDIGMVMQKNGGLMKKLKSDQANQNESEDKKVDEDWNANTMIKDANKEKINANPDENNAKSDGINARADEVTGKTAENSANDSENLIPSSVASADVKLQVAQIPRSGEASSYSEQNRTQMSNEEGLEMENHANQEDICNYVEHQKRASSLQSTPRSSFPLDGAHSQSTRSIGIKRKASSAVTASTADENEHESAGNLHRHQLVVLLEKYQVLRSEDFEHQMKIQRNERAKAELQNQINEMQKQLFLCSNELANTRSQLTANVEHNEDTKIARDQELQSLSLELESTKVRGSRPLIFVSQSAFRFLQCRVAHVN
mmetsp:Transcript_5008/g.8702  ORF Transcript_5008/g.8702 Transcript_5008/m.8702 type:complete len:342 (-) Transcript_5008:3464-4489(-)